MKKLFIVLLLFLSFLTYSGTRVYQWELVKNPLHDIVLIESDLMSYVKVEKDSSKIETYDIVYMEQRSYSYILKLQLISNPRVRATLHVTRYKDLLVVQFDNIYQPTF